MCGKIQGLFDNNSFKLIILRIIKMERHQYRDYIISLHAETSGKVDLASRIARKKRIIISPPLIRKIWVDAGLEPNCLRGGTLNKAQVEEVLRDYVEYNGDPYMASIFGNYSVVAYKKYWGIAGLEIRSSGKGGLERYLEKRYKNLSSLSSS